MAKAQARVEERLAQPAHQPTVQPDPLAAPAAHLLPAHRRMAWAQALAEEGPAAALPEQTARLG
jgi:hypothetical protein